MGKNTDALNRAEKERSLRKQGSAAISQKNELSDYGIIGKKRFKEFFIDLVFFCCCANNCFACF